MDKQLHDTLIAISVVGKMAAEKMENGREEEAFKMVDAISRIFAEAKK